MRRNVDLYDGCRPRRSGQHDDGQQTPPRNRIAQIRLQVSKRERERELICSCNYIPPCPPLPLCSLSRPMYRTTRFVGPASSAPAACSASCSNSSSSSTAAAAAHEELEISGGLYAPFQPTVAALGESVCLPRKHLIANQTAISLPMEELQEQQLHYPSSSWQHRQRIALAAHDANNDDDDDDEDDDEDNDEEKEEKELHESRPDLAAGERKLEEAIAPAALEQCGKLPANDANCLENGRKLIQVSSA